MRLRSVLTYLRLGLVGLLLCASACTRRDKTSSDASSMEELYGLREVPTFELTLSDEDVNELEAHPREWRKVGLRYGSTELSKVAMRLKGHRSFRSIDDKPAIRLRFDKGKKHKGRRFLGVKELTLNNLVEDPTMIREYLAYRLARELGLPVPKAGYAQLKINGELRGLYLVVETPDEDFLERNFSSAGGELYEGEYGCDLRPEDVDGFDLEIGSNRGPMRVLAATLAQDGLPWEGAHAPVPLDRLALFLAFSTYVGDFDGYAHSHNYRLYRDPQTSTWSMMSWGLDRSFSRKLGPYDSAGLLAERCFASEECRQEYLRSLRRVHKAAQKVDLKTGAVVIRTLLKDAVASDRKRPYNDKKMSRERKTLVDFLESRDVFVAEASACLDAEGKAIDSDGDGYACLDCSDGDPAVHPGAEEICDGIDNNCSGRIDDSPACPCTALTLGERAVSLCEHRLGFEEAEAFCRGQGAQLVELSSREEALQLRKLANASTKKALWIGASDRATEGEFVWLSSQSAVAKDLWRAGQPDNNACNQDCAMLDDSKSAKLFDTYCARRLPFVCEAVEPKAAD